MSQARDLADLGSSAEQGTVTGESLLINGNMAVSQRGSSFSFAHDGTRIAQTIDRYRFVMTSAMDQFDCTVTQDSDAPSGSGFSNSLKITTGTAESAIDANELVYLDQKIEAQNLQHLLYGTSSAKKLTLSFWVKSSVTGTYGVGLYKPDATSRIINATYTIDTASTWEYKEITFDGDTDSGGTINDDNGAGLWVSWHLASGSDYDSTDSSDWIDYVSATWAYGHAQDGVVTTAGATWQLTGAKLEVGTSATPFKHESYAENELKCKRYYQKIADRDVAPAANVATTSRFVVNAYATTNAALQHHFEVEMRDAPTVTYLACSILNNTKTCNWYDGSWRGADASTSQIYSNFVHIEIANPSPSFDGDYAAYIAQLNFTMESEL